MNLAQRLERARKKRVKILLDEICGDAECDKVCAYCGKPVKLRESKYWRDDVLHKGCYNKYLKEYVL